MCYFISYYSKASQLQSLSLSLFFFLPLIELFLSSSIWSPEAKSQLIGKYSDAGKDWRQKKRMTEERLQAEGEEDNRWWDSSSPTQNLNKLWETVKDREEWCAAVLGVTKTQTQLNDWTAITLQVTKSKISIFFSAIYLYHWSCSFWNYMCSSLYIVFTTMMILRIKEM